MGLCESSKNQGATTQQVANTAQASSNAGIMDTVKNAFGSNTTTTNTATTSKMDTVTKVGKFVIENKDALGNLIS